MFFEKRYFKKYDIEITLIYSDCRLDTPATYISKYNAVIVDNTANNEDIEKALLHELGHKIKHENVKELYHSAPSTHIKMEHEANEFMVNELVSEYINSNYADASTINFSNFATSNHLSDINIVKKAIKKQLKLQWAIKYAFTCDL